MKITNGLKIKGLFAVVGRDFIELNRLPPGRTDLISTPPCRRDSGPAP